MDLKDFSQQIEIRIEELPEVVFFCRRPKFQELQTVGGDQMKRVRSIWENNVQEWTGLELEGTEFPCNSENKKKLLDLNAMLVITVVNRLADTWNNEFVIEAGN